MNPGRMDTCAATELSSTPVESNSWISITFAKTGAVSPLDIEIGFADGSGEASARFEGDAGVAVGAGDDESDAGGASTSGARFAAGGGTGADELESSDVQADPVRFMSWEGSAIVSLACADDAAAAADMRGLLVGGSALDVGNDESEADACCDGDVETGAGAALRRAARRRSTAESR